MTSGLPEDLKKSLASERHKYPRQKNHRTTRMDIDCPLDPVGERNYCIRLGQFVSRTLSVP